MALSHGDYMALCQGDCMALCQGDYMALCLRGYMALCQGEMNKLALRLEESIVWHMSCIMHCIASNCDGHYFDMCCLECKVPLVVIMHAGDFLFKVRVV